MDPLAHFFFSGRRAAGWTALVALLATAATLWLEKTRAPAHAADACPNWVSAANAAAGPLGQQEPPVQPSAQLESVFQQLRADLQAHVFAAPEVRLTVTSREDLQAGAESDGALEVSQGLMTAVLSDDELYAVLAHEAFHVVHRDGEYRRCGHDLESASTQAVLQAQELAADKDAQDLMRRAGRDPEALSQVLDKLRQREGAAGGPTHPDIARRIQALNPQGPIEPGRASAGRQAQHN